MTSLDDALGESTVSYGPHQLKAYWRESDGLTDGDINADTPTNLTEQFDGSMTVDHSLDDSLPDTVTMTGRTDASGILSAGLNGREGLVLATSGSRAYDAAGGSWDSAAAATTVTAPIPTGALRDDYIFAAVLVDDNTASLLQVVSDPKDQWEMIGFVQDAPVAFWFFAKRRWRTNNPQLTLTSDKPVDYMSISVAFWARNPANMCLDYRLTHKNMGNQSVSSTTMTMNGGQLDNKGYFLTFWGAASGNAWTPGAGLTQVGQQSANGLTVMSAVSSTLLDSGIYNWSSTQAVANAVAVAGVFALEPFERPRWDAKQYFSPFNADSPVHGYDQDTAPVTSSARVVTATGPVDTQLFDGQMQGIPLKGRGANLDAVSKTRMDMNKSIILPMVNGQRENCTLDWIATWLMARGGSFVGPAPSKYTRYWAPMYGSAHAHWDSFQSYNNAYTIDTTTSTARKGRKFPDVVNGKWLTAMYGQQGATSTSETLLNPKSFLHQMRTDEFPHLYENGETGPLMADFFSLANSKGKLQVWIRGDAVTIAPGYLNANDDFIFKMILSVQSSAGVMLGFVEAGIASNSRNPYIRMGNDAGSYTSVSFVHTGLPTDGDWYFFGFSWDFAAGSGNANFNGTTIAATTWATNGNNVTTPFPSTDAAGRARGDAFGLQFYSHIPMSDLILDTGETYVAGQWNNYYPTPPSPGANSKVWAAHTGIAGIAEATAVNAWETLSDVSRAALAYYRCNEQDIIEWLTMFHWGETAQITSSAVHSTDTNTGDLDVEVDPSKARNAVTVQFQDTRIDTNQQPVLLYSTSTEIKRGKTQMTFALDVPVVEIHGQLFQAGSTWQIYNLTSSQITTPTLPKTQHYITPNSKDDGTGTIWDDSRVKAEIVAWDPQSVTLQFTNNTGASAYLANSGDQVPFLQILGYGFRSADAYVTQRDSAAVMLRGERALTTELNWIRDRAAAQDVAMHLLNQVSMSKAEVTVNVIGDPRRKPGQLVTLVDSKGAMISGTWRVLSVSHKMDGASYTQNLLLIPINPVGVWDASTWDNAIWGA